MNRAFVSFDQVYVSNEVSVRLSKDFVQMLELDMATDQNQHESCDGMH